MKYLLIILMGFVALNTFADGGGDDEDRIYIDYYEPNLNLKYIGVRDTLKYMEKNKPREVNVVSNVAVYDIANNKINYVFKDTITRRIIEFNFESKYLEEFKTIEFNNSYDPSERYEANLFSFSNNRNVLNRPLSDNLIIITQDIVSRNVTVWICDKFGNNIKRELEFDNSWKWEIDVKNSSIRIIRQVNSKIEVKNVKY